MSERLELIEEYQRAQIAYAKAKTHFDIIKDQLKEFGSFSEGGYECAVTVVNRMSVSLTTIQKKAPDLYIEIIKRDLVTSSESDRLTIKLKEKANDPR